MHHRLALFSLAAAALAASQSACAEKMRFDTLERGRTELTVTAGLGENHRIPDSVKDIFSFGVLKARYGWFKSPRTAAGVEFSYEEPDTDNNNKAATCVLTFRRYFMIRGSTALAWDVGIGLTQFSRKISMSGTRTNFTEIAGLTMERAIGPASAVTVEYRFSHTSNANLATPNVGINASMLGAGISWYH